MIQADDITLRDWLPSDAAALASNLNNPSVVRYLTEMIPMPYTISHARVFIGMNNFGHFQISRAILVDDILVGGIAIKPQEDIWKPGAELRFFLGEPHWGKGIMPRSIRKFIIFAFANYAFERFFCHTIEEYTSCMRVLEKAGFRKEGVLRNAISKDGKLYNSVLFSIIRSEIQIT